MKRPVKLFFLSSILFALACDRSDAPEIVPSDQQICNKLISVSIRSSLEQPSDPTKTTLGEGGSVLWSEGDSFDLLPTSTVSTEDVLVATVNNASQGLGIPVSGSGSYYVKYDDIKIVVNGNDVTSDITSTSSSQSNSYKLGVCYGTSSYIYRYMSPGTSFQGTVNSSGSCFPIIQTSSSSSISSSNVATVTITGIQISSDNTNWTKVDSNTELKNGSSWNKKDIASYSWQSRSESATKRIASISGEASVSASFNAEISEDADYYALYPSSASNKLSDNSLTFSLPQTQQYAEGSFAKGANPSVGRLVNTDGEYSVDFKNVCGVLRLKLKGNDVVTSIEVTDPTATHSLWGEGTMDINSIGEAGASFTGGSNSLTLDCGNGVQLNPSEATDFYLVVPVGSFSEGLEIMVTTLNGSATKSASVANTIKRSIIKVMPAISTDGLEFTVPEFNVENKTVQDIMANSYSVFTSGSSSYLNNSTFTTNRDNALTGSSPYRNDQPAVKTITLSGTGSATVAMATDKAMNRPVLEDEIDLSRGSYTFANMVPGTTYYYRISKDGNVVTGGSFKATGQLRMIKIDRSWNMRDLGGWTGWNGNKVKYEWIYRGGSIGGQDASGNSYYLTDEEYEELHRIGIRAHLDLRAMPGTGAWPTGTQKNGFSLGVTKLIDGDIQQITTDWCTLYSTENGAAVGNFAYIIKSLKAGKPVYFNCRTGADRTGTMGMVVLGILGCDEYTAGNNGNQIAIDYEMTSLGMDEDGTIAYNTSGAIGSYSTRSANGIWTSGYNFFRTVRNFTSFTDAESGQTYTLSNYQEKMYYYLNRYFYDHSVSTAGAVYINKSDIDWFVNFMLGTEDFVGPSWAKDYSGNTLEQAISVADSHELYHSSTYGSIGANLP